MQTLRTLSLTALFIALGAAPALAQQSAGADESRTTMSATALDAAVAGHESAVDQQRAQLAELLSRDDVREIARDHGIDMEQVESAAAGMTNSQVSSVSSLVAAVTAQNRSLGTVTISVVALILILLILILVT